MIANALQNGVKSVDWERHRATAKQGLPNDTSQAWTGLRPREMGGQAVWNKSTYEHINDACDSAHNRGSEDQIPSARSDGHTSNLTRTPKSSPILQSRSTKTHLSTDQASHLPTNGQALPSEVFSSPMVTPSQTSHAFLLAELDGNSVHATQPTALAVKYRPSVERMRASSSHAMTSSVGTNAADEHGTDVNGLGNVVTASDRRLGELTSEYKRCVGCPGAYPRSDVGV